MASTSLGAHRSYVEVSDYGNTEKNFTTDKEIILKNDDESYSKIESVGFDIEEPVLINADDYSNSSLLDMYETPEEETCDSEKKGGFGTENNYNSLKTQMQTYEAMQLPSGGGRISRNYSNVTEYGFVIQDNSRYQDYKHWFDSRRTIENQRLNNFEKEFAKTALSDNESITLDYQNRVYQFVENNGIPSKYRYIMWTKYTNLNSYKEYKVLLDRYHDRFKETLTIPDREIIKNDLTRTFPNNIHFMASPTGNYMIETLEQQLSMFSILHKKDIGYCQSLNYLCGLILLISPSNLDDNGYRRYELLNTIVMKLGFSIYDNSLSGLKDFQETLLVLIYQYLPDLFSILFEDHSYGEYVIDVLLEQADITEDDKSKKALDLPVLMIYLSKWVLNCFINILPFESCLRIIDLIILTNEEGIFWIYKITLVLLDIAMVEFKKSSSYKNGTQEDKNQTEKKLKHSLSLKLNKVLNHHPDSNNRNSNRKSINNIKNKKKIFPFHSSNNLEMDFLKVLTELFQQDNYSSLEFDTVILKRLQKSDYKIIDIYKVKKHLIKQRMTRKERLKNKLKFKKHD